MTFFKLIRIVAIISAVVLFAVWPSFAGDSSKKATSQDNELAVAYSIAEPGTEVIAVLRNNLPDSELVIQPVLRSATGNETQGQPVTLRAREVRHIPLAVLFSGITDDSGQLVLRFNSGDAQNVAASLMFRRGNKDVQAPLPAVDAAPRSDSTESRVLWYRPNATAAVYLVLANGARDAATVVVGGTQQIAIATLTTVRVPLTADDRTSGAISVVAPATVSVSALATGGAITSAFSRRSPVSTKSASQRKPDPPPVVTLRSGPLAPGACSPERGYSVLLHNMSNAPIAARATLKEYRNGVSLPIDLLPLSIAPGATVTADFQVKGSDTASAWRAVDIDYTGGVGDLAAMVLAHRKAGVETQRLSASAGKSYVGTQWLSAAEASTAIRVVNVGRKPADYSVTFFAPDSSVVYQVKGPKLKPGEEALVDLAQLREQGIADQQGRRMPGSAGGTFEAEVPDAKDEALIFAAGSNASSDPGSTTLAPLSYCCGRHSPSIEPDPGWLAVGLRLFATAYVLDSCTDQKRSTSATWWVTDPVIAGVDSLGNVYAFWPGTTDLDAEVELKLGGPYGCGDAWLETVYATLFVPYLTCTPSVTRGGTAQCSVTPSEVTLSNWKFTDTNNNVVPRNPNTGDLTWSGTMVTSGTVSVDVEGMTDPLTASIIVNNRATSSFTAVAASKRTNPYSGGDCSINVPTSPAAGNAVGYSCLDQQFFETPYLIGDNGPNQGFRYVYSASSSSTAGPTTFNFIIAGYLDDSGSEFAQKQCDNYNPNNHTGYISYAQLKSNTYEHESGNTTGHYATYKSTQDNPANNIGVAVEAAVGPPGQSEADFNQQVLAVANSKGNIIRSAAFPTPDNFCNSDVRYDPACVFRGYINWPVYASCQ